MKKREIGPISAFGGSRDSQVPTGYISHRKAALESQRPQGDVVELSEPHRAALRLLRERVLENTRIALDLPGNHRPKLQFAAIPGDHPCEFTGRLLSDQNLLASERRGNWLDKSVDAAIEQGLLQGTEQTLQVLHELDRLDAASWRLVSNVLDDFYRKTMLVSPEEIRQRFLKAI